MARIIPISEETERLLSSLPSPGDCHRWFARIAARLSHSFPDDKGPVRRILYNARDHITHRRISNREIEDAISFGYGEVTPSKSRTFTWPSTQPDLISEIVAENDPICHPAASTGMRPSEALHHLYPIYTMLCLAHDAYTYEARVWPDDLPDAELDEAGYQFICANPLKTTSALNQQGEPSIRCINNIESRRFVVIEFDKEPDKLAQAKLLNFLSTEFTPCCMVVDSAGKSLHGWFPVMGKPEDYAATFFGKAVALGADESIFDLSKLVRMPGGMRNKQHRQRILYFDEEAIYDPERP